jgi:hypothetical protein
MAKDSIGEAIFLKGMLSSEIASGPTVLSIFVV